MTEPEKFFDRCRWCGTNIPAALRVLSLCSSCYVQKRLSIEKQRDPRLSKQV